MKKLFFVIIVSCFILSTNGTTAWEVAAAQVPSSELPGEQGSSYFPGIPATLIRNQSANTCPLPSSAGHQSLRRHGDLHLTSHEVQATGHDTVKRSLIWPRNRMYLCDHPPNQFSTDFSGDSIAACGSKSPVGYRFKKTYDLCYSLYKSIYGDFKQPIYIYRLSATSKVSIIYKESFVKLCLPFFRKHNQCQEKTKITLCLRDGVAFLHPGYCSRKPDEDEFYGPLLAKFLIESNLVCFRRVCDEKSRVLDLEESGVKFRMFNLYESRRFKFDCGNSYHPIDELFTKFRQPLYITVNTIWPSCYPMYSIAWMSRPEDVGLNGAWSYLPKECQSQEIWLIAMVGLIVVNGMIGNSLVVLVMLKSSHRGEESSMLRTSLAVSDFINCIFVVTPSFYFHIQPLFGPTKYTILFNDTANPDYNYTIEGKSTSQNVFLSYQAIIFSTCSIVSLLTIFLLSVERYVITSRSLRYQHYFTPLRVKGLIFITWFISLTNSLLFQYRTDGTFSHKSYTFAKLPSGAAISTSDTVVYSVGFYFHMMLIIVAGIGTTLFSLFAIARFIQMQRIRANEWKELNMRVTEPNKWKDLYIVNSMILMFCFFLMSYAPITLYIILVRLRVIKDIHLSFYLSLWAMVASTAWNPWVYNFRSRQFRCDVLLLWRKTFPLKRKNKRKGRQAEDMSSSAT